MKIKSITIIQLLFIALHLNSQSFEWTRSFGSTAYDLSQSIATDASGNIYTTGFFRNTVDFDPGFGIEERTSNGESDIYIQKLNPFGELVWIKTFGGNSYDSGISLTLSNNRVYVTGSFEETIDFEDGSTSSTLASQGENDIFILCLDEFGNLIWVDSIGGNSTDLVREIDTNSEGNLYITGTFSGTADLSTGIDTFNATSLGATDIFILKLNSDGNTLWVKTYGGPSGESAQRLAIDEAGNIFSIGTFSGVSDFDPGNLAVTLTSAGLADIFIQKLDGQGVFQWAKKIGGPDFDEGESISVDPSGNIIIAGIFRATVDFDPGEQNLNVSSNGQTDIVIQKLDSFGNLIWNRTFGSFDLDNVQDICTDTEGNIYITGQFRQTVDFDPSDEITTLTSSQFDDIYILKLTSSGDFSFVKKIEGNSFFELAESIHVDIFNNIIIAGRIDGSLNFGTETEPEILTSTGSFDMFISKINQPSSVDVEEIDYDSVIIFPNPSNGLIQLEFNENLGDSDLSIFDSHGKLIFQKRLLNQTHETLHFTKEPGIYFAQIRTQGKLTVKKILVQ